MENRKDKSGQVQILMAKYVCAALSHTVNTHSEHRQMSYSVGPVDESVRFQQYAQLHYYWQTLDGLFEVVAVSQYRGQFSEVRLVCPPYFGAPAQSTDRHCVHEYGLFQWFPNF